VTDETVCYVVGQIAAAVPCLTLFGSAVQRVKINISALTEDFSDSTITDRMTITCNNLAHHYFNSKSVLPSQFKSTHSNVTGTRCYDGLVTKQ